MPRVLMVSSEAAPFAKTGGLADVLGALPPALLDAGNEVAVVMPRYPWISLDGARDAYWNLPVWLAGQYHRCDIFARNHRGVEFFFVDNAGLYGRNGLYGDVHGDFGDNHIRFAVLCQAALGICRLVWRPQILHCHDWQAALVPVYLRHHYGWDPAFLGMKTVFTIHNMGYQGRFGRDTLHWLGLDGHAFHPGGLEYFGDVNLMKGGIVYSDAITTVSPRYAWEIQTYEGGFGLDGVLRSRGSAITGILNGVDYSEWNPETDPYIARNYSADDLSGKQACKADLVAEMGLPPEAMDRPLVGIISRFAEQKGFDILAQVAWQILEEDLSLVILGSGDYRYEGFFKYMASARPDKAAVRVAIDNRLAHKIEAGADLFLMPSRYEPCGLNQMYSLRYGTVPLVRATGGLDDTIEEGTGFKFWDYSGWALLEGVRYAVRQFSDRERWERMMRNGMAKDFSWNASAAQYTALYRRLAG